MAKRPQLTVLGSLNMDLSVTVPRLPNPGATVLGSTAVFTPGGKGANQAVAAARLGADVRMVGCVGDDDFGRQLRSALAEEGVATEAVRVAPGVATGLAMISVDQAGENIITVAQGANREVDATQTAAGSPDVLVISAEIPVATIQKALAQKQAGTLCVLNLAPAPPEAAAIVAAGVDWLVVNESEAAAILGRDINGLTEATPAATDLLAAGAKHGVVITVGAKGAVLATPDRHDPLTIEAFEVQAVDTVGAGDCFVGALAVALAAGIRPVEAVRAAAAAGAAAATRPGAQAGLPRPADIQAITGLTWPVA